MNGIDVSSWQPGNVVSLVPHEFAIVKATQGSNFKSPTFDQQITDALNTGKAGAYHFDNGDANWQAEADNFLNVIAAYKGKVIVVWDWEASAISAGSGRLSAILGYLRSKLGFPPVLYASGSPLVSSGGNDAAAANNCGVWCANYNLGYQATGYRNDLKPYTNCIIHQYSSSGRLPGYGGNLDLNNSFIDAAAWDAYATGVPVSGGGTPPAPAKKTNDQIADEVIAGQWGNGQDRVNALSAAGYDPAAIQAVVNQKVNAAPAKKSNEEIANEVIAGQWGNGADRTARLQAAGYDAGAIQAIVNQKVGATPAPNQPTYVTVASGPSGYLGNIAAAHGTTVAQIVAWNKAKYPNISSNYVQAGWVLRVS